MRKLPTILAGLFLAITLTRVAALAAEGMKAGVLGWLFSIGLGAGVFTAAYFTRVSALDRNGNEDRRSRQVRRVAGIALIFFVAADGFFNLIEVLRSVNDPTLTIASWIYGLFPTIAAAIFGSLQGYVDRLPKPPQKYSIGVAARAWVVGLFPQPPAEPEVLPAVIPQTAKEPAKVTAAYVCSCGYSTSNQRSYAAHRRYCKEKK